MSSVQSTHVFTSESVSEGHPDKIADQISDAILDACIRHDPNAHVACETAVGPNLVVNLGEITCKGWEKVDSEAIAREVVREIGYVRPDEAFSFDTFEYKNALHGQSPDISQGVDRGSCENQGAGDQGIMFGYATNETPEMMPPTLIFSHRLLRRCAELRKSGAIPFLRPDAKAQVSIRYSDGRPAAITAVDGQNVTTTEEVIAIKDAHQVGDTLTFSIWRPEGTSEISITLMDTNDIYG